MNKKIITLIIVILISFCFISIVVANNASYNDNNATDYNQTIDNNQTIDKNKTNEPQKNYILAKGKGNVITFSDGYKGFRLDYSKSPASSGNEFKHAPTSKASNSNKLKLAIIECYKQGLTGQIGKIIADFIKTGSSNTPVGKAVAASHEKIGDRAIVKINETTVAVFDFEYLESVSGNESDYFAYKVSFITIDDDEDEDVNQSSGFTDLTNTTNITNITSQIDNETNATFVNDLYDFFEFLANVLYGAWQPIIDTLINDILMFVNGLEELVNLFENIMTEIQTLIDAIERLIDMLGLIWEELDGILKLLGILITTIEQIFNLIMSLLNFIIGLISTLISLVQQILGLIFSIIDFITNLINQITALIKAIVDLLNTAGSSMSTVIENAGTLINIFVIITIGALYYNSKR